MESHVIEFLLREVQWRYRKKHTRQHNSDEEKWIVKVNDIRSAKNERVLTGLMYKECKCHCTLVYKKTRGRRNPSVPRRENSKRGKQRKINWEENNETPIA